MDKRILDVDPFTGTTTYHHYDADKDLTVIEEIQDVEPFLQQAKIRRNEDDYSKRGIKNDMWHYAIIPNAIITKLKMRGIDVFNKDQMKDALKVINTEYPWLKTTRGRHG